MTSLHTAQSSVWWVSLMVSLMVSNLKLKMWSRWFRVEQRAGIEGCVCMRSVKGACFDLLGVLMVCKW